jgi:hypothetical protein
MTSSTSLRMAACALLAAAATFETFAQAPSKAASGLNGVWVIPGTGRNDDGTQHNNQGRGTQAQSAWTLEPLPFTPAGRAAFDANKPIAGPRQVKSALSNDPRDKANPVGLYRMIQTSGNGRPFEIDQHDGKIIQLFSYGRAWRVIYTDGRPAEENAVGPFWYGYSVGKWEGDTLVVTTLDLDDRAWLDGWGTPLSPDARVTERWRRVAPDRIEFSFTVNDPAYYSKPWSSRTLGFALQKKGVEPVEMITAPADIEEYTSTLLLPASTPGNVK